MLGGGRGYGPPPLHLFGSRGNEKISSILLHFGSFGIFCHICRQLLLSTVSKPLLRLPLVEKGVCATDECPFFSLPSATGKVMFSQVSVCPQEERCWQTPHPPPAGRLPLAGRTPLPRWLLSRWYASYFIAFSFHFL